MPFKKRPSVFNSSQVYDPRDRKTGEPFEFPDTADLMDYTASKILPSRNELEAKLAELVAAKAELLGNELSDNEGEQQLEVLIDLHTELR